MITLIMSEKIVGKGKVSVKVTDTPIIPAASPHAKSARTSLNVFNLRQKLSHSKPDSSMKIPIAALNSDRPLADKTIW